MEIYMTHPQHGAMHVYAEVQAAEAEKSGWKRSTEPTAAKPVERDILHLPKSNAARNSKGA